MADKKCKITSATIEIEAPKKDNVGETTAMAKCKASAELPDDETISGEGGTERIGNTVYYIANRTLITYSELVYKWTASSPGDVDKEGAEVNLHFENLGRGEKNTIYATVKVSCTKKIQPQWATDSWVEYDDDGNQVDSGWGDGTWYNNGQATETEGACENSQQTTSIDVWTRPGTFEQYGGGWKMSSGSYIVEQLTSGWTVLWTEHMNKIGHWHEQSSADVCQNTTQGSGDWILASWFNACAALINQYTDDQHVDDCVKGGPYIYDQRSYITAGIINELAEGNQKTGEV